MIKTKKVDRNRDTNQHTRIHIQIGNGKVRQTQIEERIDMYRQVRIKHTIKNNKEMTDFYLFQFALEVTFKTEKTITHLTRF